MSEIFKDHECKCELQLVKTDNTNNLIFTLDNNTELPVGNINSVADASIKNYNGIENNLAITTTDGHTHYLDNVKGDRVYRNSRYTRYKR